MKLSQSVPNNDLQKVHHDNNASAQVHLILLCNRPVTRRFNACEGPFCLSVNSRQLFHECIIYTP
jgi:hypothetical protein